MDETKTTIKAPAIKRGWLRAVLLLLSFIIATGIFQAITAVVYAIVTDFDLFKLQELLSKPGSLGLLFIFQVVSLIVTCILIWVFRKYVDRKSIKSLGLEIKGKIKDIIWGFMAGLILMAIGFFILLFSKNLTISEIRYNPEAIFGGLIFFTLVAIIEELVIRGYVLNNLMESTKNKYLALFFSSVLFALVHGFNPNLNLVGFINLIIAGLALGISYIHTKNLWFPIFLHLSWNYFQGPIFGFEVSGIEFGAVINHEVTGNELLTGGNFGLEGSLLITVILLGIIFVTDRVFKKKMQVSN